MKASEVIIDDARRIVDELAVTLDELAGTTLLVTGANGFLCSYLVDIAAEWNARRRGAPCRVIALDNMLTGSPDRLAHLGGRADITFLHHDISKPLAIDGPIDWIVHGASIASPTTYRRFPLETLDANVNGTRFLLEMACDKKTRGMLVMSTSEIYGDPVATMIPTPETYRGNVSCFGPRACYDESKRLAETLGYIFHRQRGVPVKLIRPFNIYGPGLRLDDQRVVPDLLKKVLARDPIVLFSDGRPTRAFCYVSDAVRAMFLILCSSISGEAFNVGNDQEEISMADLARCMSAVAANVLGPPAPGVEFRVSADADYLTDNPMRRCADLSKLRSAFPAWIPLVSLADGFARTLQSYRQLGLCRP